MRAIRLVRLVKLVRMWEQAVDSVQSEYLMLALRVFVLLANILLTSHYIACFWYLFGTYDGEDSGWPGYYGLAGASLDRLYVSSLHWAVSQAGFGASALLPVGAAERCYAMAVSLVCGDRQMCVSLSLSLSIYIYIYKQYIYIYIYISEHVYICIYDYVYTYISV